MTCGPVGESIATMIRSSVVMTLARVMVRAESVVAGLEAVSGASAVGWVLVIEITAGKMSWRILITRLGSSSWLVARGDAPSGGR